MQVCTLPFAQCQCTPLPRSITYLRADFVQQGQRIGQQRSLLLHQCGLGVVHQPHLRKHDAESSCRWWHNSMPKQLSKWDHDRWEH